jgi:hypothetical protein
MGKKSSVASEEIQFPVNPVLDNLLTVAFGTNPTKSANSPYFLNPDFPANPQHN